MKTALIAWISITLFEMICFSHGEMYNSDTICRRLQTDGDVVKYTQKLTKDAETVLTLPDVKNWTGKKRLGEFCTLGKRVEKEYKLHVAIAILIRYVTTLLQKHDEKKKILESFGYNFSCNEEVESIIKITYVNETLCYLYRNVEFSKSYTKNFDITITPEHIDDISIDDSFQLIKRFAKCVGKAKKRGRNVDRCIRSVFQQCKKQKTQKKRGRRRKSKGGN